MLETIEKLAFLSRIRKGLAGQGENAYHAAELAGLGAIAAPYLYSFTGDELSDNTTRALELGGLGTLAAPSALHFLKKLPMKPMGAR